MQIELPISKSIANRWLMLQAIHGDELMPVSDSMPDDVQILHRALSLIQANVFPRRSQGVDCERNVVENKVVDVVDLKLYLGNCGTAMRFLTACCAQLEGQTTILDGVERMRHRPIGQLVDALREIGADIEYLGEEGFPPLRIKGCILDKHRIVTINNPQSTQFVSALLLIGANVQTDSTSPYITLTRALIEQYALASFTEDSATSVRRSGGNKISSVENKINLDFVSEANRSPIFLERDWSSAAFWYEYVALHGGEIKLPGLHKDSLQGDKIVADIFAHLGVHTEYTEEGITITKNENEEFFIQQPKQLYPTTLRGNQHPASPGAKANNPCRSRELIRAEVVDIVVNNQNSGNLIVNGSLHQDFSSCPDLYPAVALACERLGVELHATGVESLPLKESDRLRAVAEHRTDADHRMAMALLIAGYEVDDTACISKSYPQFLEQFHRINTLKLQ